ncbi:hypothetical protein A2U01_0046272, partial [Trifolium medium]|nr:hypothetical protein [Trifolium medium]
MAEISKEIKQSCTRITKLLQEEIFTSESTNDSLPTPPMEPIEKHSITCEGYADLTNDVVPTSEETLSSIEPSDEQSAEESVGLRTSMVESVTPIVCMPLLNESTYAFPKGITRFVNTPNLAIQVFDLSSCKGVVVHLF